MTDIERAIQEFEDEAHHHSAHPNISDEAKAVALSALYEKLERSKGCDMCMTEYDREDWRDGGGHDFRVDGDTLYYFDSRAGWKGVAIRYCPSCGRNLAE